MKTASAACTCTCRGGIIKDQKAGKMPFARGYHIEFGGGRGLPGADDFGGSERILGGGYGVELKRNMRKCTAPQVGFTGRGEMIPNADSYCEIDPDKVDQWGIPVLRFHFKWSQDEILQAKHMQDTFKEIIDRGGRQVLHRRHRRKQLGHLARRRDHSRSGRGAHGRRSEDVGVQFELPGVGLQEPVCHRCGAVCEQCGQESDADDYRAGMADFGVHRGAGEEEELMT
jgi:hypothetical protein